MLTFLYSLFILPFEFLLGSILNFIFSITTDYGVSIILLSIVINTLVLPLAFLSEKYRKIDKNIRDAMQDDIDNVKKSYTGRERYLYIQTIHRQFGYRNFSSMKASLGLLLQIPFFIASFQLLSNYQDFQGVSFGVINDLSQVDDLLFGINLLPLLMLSVNLISIYIFSIKNNESSPWQLLGLSLIFFVFLYNSASGLLLYWVTSNTFVLLKGFVQNKQPLVLNLFSFKQPFRFDNVDKVPLPLWATSLLVLVGIAGLILYVHDYMQNVFRPVIFISIFIYLFFLLFFEKLSTCRFDYNIFKSISSIFLFIFIVAYLSFIQVDIVNYWYAPSRHWLFASLVLFVTLYFIQNIDKFNDTDNLFLWTYFPLLLLLFLVNPLMLYNSSADFNISVKEFMSLVPMVFAITCVLLVIFYRLVNNYFRKLLILFGLFGLAVSTIYSFIVIKDYGLLDHFVFMFIGRLAPSKLEFLMEFLFLFFLTIIIVFLISNYQRKIKKILIFLSFILVVFVIINIPNERTVLDSKQTNEIDLKNSENMTNMSKEKNILVFILDAFSGSMMHNLYQNNMDLIKQYHGFTWYKNTLSTGTDTNLSIPSIYGGKFYTENQRNERGKYNAIDKSERIEAYNVYPDAFIDNNWDVSYFNTYLIKKEEINENVNNADLEFFTKYYLTKNPFKNIVELKKHSQNTSYRMLYVMSLFKSTPLFGKNFIYRTGKWVGIDIKDTTYRDILEKSSSWGFLNYFEKFIAFNSSKKTFKMFHLIAPHAPFVIAKDGSLNPSKSSLEIESYKLLEKIGEIIRKMKTNRVYDNTKIIIVSDHGSHVINSIESLQFLDANTFNNKMQEFSIHTGNLYPLLLIKDFNDNKKFKISDKFMSNSDLAGVICSALDDNCNIQDIDYTKINTNRSLIINSNNHKNKMFLVKDSIFNPENWKEVDKRERVIKPK